MSVQCERMYAGEDGWSEWIHPLPGYLMQCCDCGLIHDAEFQIAGRIGDGPLNPGEDDETGVVIFRMRRHEASRKDGWRDGPAHGLEAAILDFKAALPGWWFTVGECQVSADASCGPTTESEHIKLIPKDRRFDEGFHADLPQPATMAEALRAIMQEALAAVSRLNAEALS